jgi:HSP90 family molecular chaperone
MKMATFTVDTHLFRELGELLVGRDSTALIELIKNAYDADATQVLVYGESLNNPSRGFIKVQDNGIGMSTDDFANGFLRIASRTKEENDRRSLTFNRRYTGAKGIGRLAAHKLARFLKIESKPLRPKSVGANEGNRALPAKKTMI